MRKLTTTLVATAALAVAIAANAEAGEVTTLAKSGGWSAYIVDTKDGPACGMGIYNRDASQTIQIKWFIGNDEQTFDVQLMKRGWRIPEDTEVRVEVGFDRDTFITGPAKGGPSNLKGVGLIAFYFGDTKMAKNFLEEFAHANKMWIKFPDGNETPWVADMTGSREVSTAFAKCVVQMEARNTQPHGKSSPPATSDTQPFEKKPKLQKPATERGA